MDWELSGDLLTDLSQCIAHGNPINLQYTDKKGQSSDRKALPIEIRGDRCWMADLDKMGLRVFMLGQIVGYTVIDEFIDKESLSLK